MAKLIAPLRFYSRLKRVISGGQVGADVAGLRAAKAAGIQTGGYMPLGFLTLNGMKPEYAELYGMEESTLGGSYKTRTWLNVKSSDGTIRFAYRFSSPGEVCTFNAIDYYRKPHWDIAPRKPLHPKLTAAWIVATGIETLNVAGNADEHLEPFVYDYLREVFAILGHAGKRTDGA